MRQDIIFSQSAEPKRTDLRGTVPTLKTMLTDWLTAGQHNRLGKHIERNIQLAVLYSFVGVIQFLLFGIFFLLAGRFSHAIALVFFAFFLIFSKERLRYEANRSARSQKPFCLLLADIDDFKCINDLHGHDAGDLALQAISRRMTVSLRKQDVIARWGGEEFLILLPESGMEEGFTIAERLLKTIAGQPFRIQDKSLQLSLSIGLARFDPGSDLEKTITRADQALYRAKNRGKKRVETANDEAA